MKVSEFAKVVIHSVHQQNQFLFCQVLQLMLTDSPTHQLNHLYIQPFISHLLLLIYHGPYYGLDWCLQRYVFHFRPNS